MGVFIESILRNTLLHTEIESGALIHYNFLISFPSPGDETVETSSFYDLGTKGTLFW